MVVFYISYKYNWINVESYCISLLSLKDHTLHICLGQRKRKENQVRLAQSETSDLMRVAILSSSTRSAVPPSARRAAFAGAAAARSLVQEPLSLKPDQAQSLVGFFQQPKDWVLSSPSVGSGLTQVNSSCPLPPTKPRPLPHDWGWQAAPWRIREIARGGSLQGWQLQQLAPPPPSRCDSCVVHPTPTCGQSATHSPPSQLDPYTAVQYFSTAKIWWVGWAKWKASLILELVSINCSPASWCNEWPKCSALSTQLQWCRSRQGCST